MHVTQLAPNIVYGRGCETMNIVYVALWVQLSDGIAFPQPDKNCKFLVLFIIIRECDSTLYVGLARAVPPTNTNFRLTFFTNPT